ncbi:CHAT domain-containing protein [Streptomyces sp. Tu102]|uniref:CHAT domain-containing protein n=1 Tax=Streptomyces TaxID=1883 RepID=UPI001BDBBEA9|nr:CHAT domain-containing protein [Streptomyces sp. Tu102]MBT1098315.1 CHAT domain-containing protein [Streptomyces sp. Tu102]
MGQDVRRVVLLEYVRAAGQLAVFGVRADWDRPRTALLDVDHEELALFVSANLDSYHSVRDLAGMPELLHQYDEIVRPLAEWSEPGDVVCLIPHGALHRMPLHALRVGERYLIERNPVVYAPSVSVLRHSLTGRDRAVSEPSETMAVFGDSRQNLPDAAAEATMLGEQFGAEVRLGAAVTREHLRQALTQADVVHVAGHAAFDQRDPLRSGLELHGSDVLTAGEIFGMPRMRTSLVTLSGCETGLNLQQSGDELIGLTRAFLYARASSLLVSLWSVADDSTAFFMRRFYDHLLGSPGLAKADALRTAVLETMRAPGWGSLYHWAPFTLIGDWL